MARFSPEFMPELGGVLMQEGLQRGCSIRPRIAGALISECFSSVLCTCSSLVSTGLHEMNTVLADKLTFHDTYSRAHAEGIATACAGQCDRRTLGVVHAIHLLAGKANASDEAHDICPDDGHIVGLQQCPELSVTPRPPGGAACAPQASLAGQWLLMLPLHSSKRFHEGRIDEI